MQRKRIQEKRLQQNNNQEKDQHSQIMSDKPQQAGQNVDRCEADDRKTHPLVEVRREPYLFVINVFDQTAQGFEQRVEQLDAEGVEQAGDEIKQERGGKTENEKSENAPVQYRSEKVAVVSLRNFEAAFKRRHFGLVAVDGIYHGSGHINAVFHVGRIHGVDAGVDDKRQFNALILSVKAKLCRFNGILRRDNNAVFNFYRQQLVGDILRIRNKFDAFNPHKNGNKKGENQRQNQQELNAQTLPPQYVSVYFIH